MNKIWLAHYPPEVKSVIEIKEKNLNEIFDYACAKFPQHKALECHHESFSFSQTKILVEKFAQVLHNLGIAQGDRVAIMLPNSVQYAITVFATLRLGAIVVNINPLYSVDEVEYLLTDSSPKAIIILDVVADKLNTIHQQSSLKHIIISKIGDLYSWLKMITYDLVLKYVKHTIPTISYKPSYYRNLINDINHPALPKINVKIEDLAFLQYTGATTGRPKGAMLSHGNILANIAQTEAWINGFIPQLDQQIFIVALPLYHIFSLTANLFFAFSNGAHCVMIPNARDIPEMIKVLKYTPFTVFNGLDTLYNRLLAESEFTGLNFKNFIFSISGGMPLREAVARHWFEVTGVNPSNCYGLTETSPAVTMSRINNIFDVAVGYPIPSTDVEIRDLNRPESALPTGETGLVFIHGPQVMSGYWKNPEATASALSTNGWFNTQDIGYLSNDGRLTLVGRKVEMVIVSGFNVYPAEVERVLNLIPGVKEAIAIGSHDNETGEALYAFVVSNNEHQLSEEIIKNYCKEHLARYKTPKKIIFVKELPKSTVGKILKRELVKQYIEGKTA